MPELEFNCGSISKIDVTYHHLLRRMIRYRFKHIGDNDGDFRYKLFNENVHTICCTSDVTNFIWKQQKDFAGHVVRMPFECCEEQMMFNEGKYYRIGRATPSLLEQVLKYNNSTINNVINNSLKRRLENSTSSPIY